MAMAVLILAAGVQALDVLTNSADAAYMRRLASATGADAALQWASGSDPCNSSWHGVNCDGNGCVVGIDLHGRGLAGSIPGNDDDNSSLSYLRELDVSDNKLGGALPVLAVPRLHKLNLHGNAFSSMPEQFFAGMRNLVQFDMGNNTRLERWSLPVDLQLLADLQIFEASSARINGTLSGFLGNTTAFPFLWNVSLPDNELVGTVPENFASQKLKILDLSNNALRGPIGFVNNLPGLTVLRLDHNNFTGPLPEIDGILQVFTVAHNRLTGLVPQLLVQRSAGMSIVSLAGNLLQGPVPELAAAAKNDVAEAAASGSFCRMDPGPCDPKVTSLLAVAAALHFPEVLARSWRRNDACAGWLGVHCEGDRRVTGVNLSRLGLNGTIDPALASLVSLRFILLSGNNISGSIPPAIARLPSLRVLDVSDNVLAGVLPKFRPGVEVWAEGNPALNVSSFSPPSISGQHRSSLVVAAVVLLVLGLY